MKLSTNTFTITYSCLLLLYSAIALAANTKQNPGIVIPDVAPYPLYQYSKIDLPEPESEQLPSLHLNFTNNNPKQSLVSALENMGVNIKHADNFNEVKTDWIAWHYDEESKKTQSNRRNNFFSLDLRDRYRFTFVVSANNNHTDLRLKKVERSEEKDITPDTEIMWLKWQDEKPDKNAVNDFLKRLQTEYEKLALASSIPVASTLTVGSEITKLNNNQISLNMTVNQAWAALIKQVTLKSIPLSNTHNSQHMLNTEWHYADYDTETLNLAASKAASQRHQFQVIVIPGSTVSTSSILVYHTAFQQKPGQNSGRNSDPSSWSNENTQEAIASAFLNFLDLNQ